MEGSFNFPVKTFFVHNSNKTYYIWVGYMKYKLKDKSDKIFDEL